MNTSFTRIYHASFADRDRESVVAICAYGQVRLLKYLSWYADDQLFKATVCSVDELQVVLDNIGFVLDLLEQMGMELFPGKSQVIF